MQVLNLSGKSIVVIGGTTGLGFSAARCFVRGGARVVVVGRDPGHVRAARKSLGRAAHALAGDAMNPATAGLGTVNDGGNSVASQWPPVAPIA